MQTQTSHSLQQDPFNLNRFVEAQEGIYEQALTELRRARKSSHWMWFIFPQVRGLGSSPTSTFYAIQSLEEAKAYLNHPVLGQRLQTCCEVLLSHKEKSAPKIFGFPDDLKLRSSMTLFAAVSKSDSVFAQVLGRYFNGQPDQRTLDLLKQNLSGPD